MSEKLRIGIAGLGRAGFGMHLKELDTRKETYEVAAVCDIIPERVAEVCEKYGCRGYSDINELVCDPKIELVDIATRSREHYEHAKIALEAGKPVLLEKPMCLTYEQAKAIMELAAKPGMPKLYIRHNRRFDPDFMHVKEICDSGLLGEVYEVQLRRYSYARRDDWQTIVKYGGGQLLNWGPHIIDHSLRFLGSPVRSFTSSLKQIAAAGDAEDALKIVLQGENGRIVDMEISGGAAISAPMYRVLGTKGSLVVESNIVKLKYVDPDAKLAPRTSDPGTPARDFFGTPEKLPWIEREEPLRKGNNYVIWDYLYDSVKNGADYPIKPDQALEVLRVIDECKKGTRFEVKPE